MKQERSPKRKPVSPEDEAARHCCEKFLPEARKIEPRDVISCRSDVKLALHNVVWGVNAVLVHEAAIRNELPKIDIAMLKSLIELSQAIEYAARQVDRQAPASRELRDLIARGRELRLILLTAAESLAAVGVLPSHVVAKIRAGKGDIDAAGDCVELATLFQKHAAAVRGKTPVTVTLVKEAMAVGSELMIVLKPRKSKAPKEVQEELREARDVRDRLWTLLVLRHDPLRRVGAYLFGLNEVDKHVPSLQAAKRAPKKAVTAKDEASRA